MASSLRYAYRRRGELHPDLEGHFVYTVYCPVNENEVLVKVGISKCPHERIYQVHCGSPYPAELAAFCMAGCKRIAGLIESRILSVFKSNQTRGEWLLLTTDEATKKRFAAVCKASFELNTTMPLKWKTLNAKQIKTGSGKFDWQK